MTLARPAYRGKPLVALLMLLGGWVTMRAITWEITPAPWTQPIAFAERAEAARLLDRRVATDDAPPSNAVSPPSAAVPAAPPPAVRPAPSFEPAPSPRPAPPSLPPRQWAPIQPALRYYTAPPPAPVETAPPASAPSAAPAPSAGPVPVRISAAHQLMWMAAVANLPLPPQVLAQASALSPLPARASATPSRWSADGWLLLRRGGAVAPAGGLAPATYGASQLGAVLRYRLAPGSAHRPALYLRGSAALNGSRERELAFGASARPIAGLPLAVAAEARVNRQPGATRARPAAFAYTELAPFDLPLGMRGEFYGQAGYVGGNFASAFADGQLRLDRQIVRLGRGELRAGAGLWGGAQKGASRFDVGPAATLGLPLGGSAGARLGLDWRFRVAGNAAPSSGPALTLSAGF
jgi:hypothetical protein